MNFKMIVRGVITLGLLFIGYISVTFYVYPELTNRGLFGDSFGALNALFSGFAFLGIIYTIILQTQELGLQRKELELTRAELKRAAEAQEASAAALAFVTRLIKSSPNLIFWSCPNVFLVHHAVYIAAQAKRKAAKASIPR